MAISYSDSYSVVRPNRDGLITARMNHKFLTPQGFASCFSSQPLPGMFRITGATVVAAGKFVLPAGTAGRFVLLDDDGKLVPIAVQPMSKLDADGNPIATVAPELESFLDIEARDGEDPAVVCTTPAADGAYDIAQLTARLPANNSAGSVSALSRLLVDEEASDIGVHVQRDAEGTPQTDADGNPYYEVGGSEGDVLPRIMWKTRKVLDEAGNVVRIEPVFRTAAPTVSNDVAELSALSAF